jgi:pyruvate dehydrogenase E1 component beta subunit
VPDPLAAVPLGSAALRRDGGDLAMVSLGVGVHRCLQAAEVLAGDGVGTAVLDLRSVAPLDTRAVVDLARATGRVLVVDEDYTRGGLSGEVAAVLAEEGTGATYARVTTEDTIPYARELEAAALPNVPRILAAARALLAGTR